MNGEQEHPDAIKTREFFARTQDKHGVDRTQIREMLRLSPIERLRAVERAWLESRRLQELGRRHRERRANEA